MKIRKLFGFFFVLLAVLFLIPVAGIIPVVIIKIHEFNKLYAISTEADISYQFGYITGIVLTWIILISLDIYLWIYGLKWAKKQPEVRYEE